MTRGRAIGISATLGVVILAVVLLSSGSGPGEEETVTDVAVHVTEVRRGTVRRFVTGYGRVEPEPAGDGRSAGGALITSLVDGVVSQINCMEGERVEEGALLFRLDSRMAEVAVQRARQQVDFAESVFTRQEELLASDGTSQRAYEEARQQLDTARSDLAAAETDLAYYNIKAPLAGTVVRLNASLGQHVDATSVLAQVVDLSRLVVTVGVPRAEIAGVLPGQTVLIGPQDSPRAVGTVTVLGRGADPVTGTYRVQASIPADATFLPGQFTEAHIAVEEHADVLVVPDVSVVTGTDGQSWIAVVEGDRAMRMPVTVGVREAGVVEVSGVGLEEGARVVTDEAYSLPEETRVRVESG